MQSSTVGEDEVQRKLWHHSLFLKSLPFTIGCCSGMIATIVIQPIDTVKVRLQLMQRKDSGSSPLAVVRDLMARGRLGDLYHGLSAGLLRQMVYGTARLGLFTTFEQMLERRAREKGTTLTFAGRTLAGLSAGTIAAFIGNPTEVVLIRMQADSTKNLEHQARYRSAFDALRRITREEGIRTLWRGVSPTIVRAMSTNFGQLAFFSETKNQLQRHTQLSVEARTAVAAATGGFAGAFLSQPFDFVKTRLQNQALGGYSDQLPLYKGTVDCFIQVAKTEGLMRFYRDIWPYVWRVIPQSVITLFLSDQLMRIVMS